MSTIIYIPYTYLIGWSKLNWWYYGVRYAKNCNPDDLWNTYFTSSKELAIVRDIYGEPDIIEIRHIFKDSLSARNWETKVLKRMNVIHNLKWLNKTNNISFDPSICGIKQKGMTKKQLPYLARPGREGKNNPNFDKKRTDEWKKDHSKILKGKRKWINNGTITKNISIDELQYYLNTGWQLGRLISENHSKNISISKIGVPNYKMRGFKHTSINIEKNKLAQIEYSKTHTNSNGKSIHYNNKTYIYMKDLKKELNITNYILHKMIKNGEVIIL